MDDEPQQSPEPLDYARPASYTAREEQRWRVSRLAMGGFILSFFACPCITSCLLGVLLMPARPSVTLYHISTLAVAAASLGVNITAYRRMIDAPPTSPARGWRQRASV